MRDRWARFRAFWARRSGFKKAGLILGTVSVVGLMTAVALVVTLTAGSAAGAASPQGSLLAYQSEIGGDWEIYVTRVGERPRQLTHNHVDDTWPSWSPDGRTIFYSSGTHNGVGGSEYLMNADGSNKRRLARTTKRPWPEIRSTSPDGRWKAYGVYEATQTSGNMPNGPGIYVRRTNGSGKPRKISDLYSPDPNWSTDGKWISFWTRELPGGKVTPDYSHFNLWAVSPNGENEILVARKAVRETWQPAS
jgi:hypothetical protein